VGTGAINTFMFTMIKEKRWVLKSLLEATGTYKKDENGNYVFDTDELVGKRAIGMVQNVEEEYTDREMKQQSRKRSQIRRFMGISSEEKEGVNDPGVKDAGVSDPEEVEIPF
jgi:hypothetical protein